MGGRGLPDRAGEVDRIEVDACGSVELIGPAGFTLARSRSRSSNPARLEQIRQRMQEDEPLSPQQLEVLLVHEDVTAAEIYEPIRDYSLSPSYTRWFRRCRVGRKSPVITD